MQPHHSFDRSASTRQAEALNQAGADGLRPGNKVWVRGVGSAAWEMGELRTRDGTHAQVVLDRTGKVVTVTTDHMVPANPRLQEGIPDLTHLTHLNEPGILFNLNYRYGSDDIYTFAGPVLIAVNPCKPLQLYTPEIANQYKAAGLVNSASMPPHIYLVAANAFRRMLRERTSQSLIVNGESGAGKTETTKKAMQYFATLAGGTGVEDQVLETNPILEAFGNAKTLRNHNSSRFGKLIQIHFSQSNAISGAAIKTYLLEKSRVVHQLKGERSYHIFYQLVRGASDAQRAEFRLPARPEQFKYLSHSGCTEIEGVNDAAEFKVVCEALADIGIDRTTQAHVFRLLSGIMWLGNLTFAKDPAQRDNDATMVLQDEACEACCALLGLTHDALTRGLTRKRIIAPGEVVIKLLNLDESLDSRDALSKALYAALFDWIVARINAKLDSKGRAGSGLSIAILDIYGFEQFQTNSFEQLCINYANERLQQQFTRHLFTLEQLEYESEGIDWTKVEFIDNYECVDAIEAAPPRGLGVLAVLDSQCKFPKATDDSFVQKLKEALGNHTHFGVNPRQPSIFTILHYAGAVAYTCNGFLDKNKDTINADLVDLMVKADGSVSALVPVLGAQVRDDVDAISKRGQTVGSRFSLQLKDLISELDATGLHFVRCIKPNSKLAPGLWEEEMALHQLRCCGVLEVARIARAGYPTRYTHQSFAERYAILLPREQQAELLATAAGSGGGGPERATSSGALAACRQLLSKFGLKSSDYQVGATKVFFRPGALGYVEDKWASMQASALKIQTHYRMHRARSKYWAARRAAAVLQAAWRAREDRLEFAALLRETRAARVIQTRWRGYHARKQYLATRKAVIAMQMGWRRYLFRKRVHARVLVRLAREEAERIEQSKFETLRKQFGVEMDDVRAALAAWNEARKANGGDPEAVAAAMASAQAAREAEAVAFAQRSMRRGVLVVDVPDSNGHAADGICQACGKQLGVDEFEARGYLPSAHSGVSVGVGMTPHLSPMGIAVGTSPMARAPSIRTPASPDALHLRAARATAEMEVKDAMEKLQMETIRLGKQLQLERSLKDRYQRKYEEQNESWMEQIGLLQEYILQVRAAFGDARLPPLPTALASAGVALPSKASGTSDRSHDDPYAPVAHAPEPGPAPAARGFAHGMDASHREREQQQREERERRERELAPQASAASRAGPYGREGAAPDNAMPPDPFARPVRKPLQRATNLAGAHHAAESSEEDDEGGAGGWRGRRKQGGGGGGGIVGGGGGGHRDLKPSPSMRVDIADVDHDYGPRGTYPFGTQPSPSPAAHPNRIHRAQPVPPPGGRPAGPAAKYVSTLDSELGKVQQVLDDDVDFINEVAAGQAHAPDMDPAAELMRLKRKFELWRNQFKDKITTAEEVLKKLDRMGGIAPSGGFQPPQVQLGGRDLRGPAYGNGSMSSSSMLSPGGTRQDRGVLGKFFKR